VDNFTDFTDFLKFSVVFPCVLDVPNKVHDKYDLSPESGVRLKNRSIYAIQKNVSKKKKKNGLFVYFYNEFKLISAIFRPIWMRECKTIKLESFFCKIISI